MVVDKVTKPGGKVAKCTSMVIESGNPELKMASTTKRLGKRT